MQEAVKETNANTHILHQMKKKIDSSLWRYSSSWDFLYTALCGIAAPVPGSPLGTQRFNLMTTMFFFFLNKFKYEIPKVKWCFRELLALLYFLNLT